ncbi:uncharacterized protein LOC111915446 [Lactuca sativa]|uniref:uncharacterized protein LOC111915446 n=1 Tax=Lactuca sativa TaxID=4236 RepID=UPI001C68961A|nr:uncharacterized protein LOC111915446 [Lactuca sativa]
MQTEKILLISPQNFCILFLKYIRMDCSTSYSSSSSTIIRHIRSISLPNRSHPSTLHFEEEFINFKNLEASISSVQTTDTICDALLGLERLHTYVNDHINLPLTRQALSHEKHQKFVDKLLDQSMMLLDVCGSVRDAMQQFKQHLRDLQSAQRRGKGDMSINTSFFNKMRKDTRRTLSSLKQISNKMGDTSLLNLDHQLSDVIRSLRDTSLVSISVYESIMSLTSALVSKPKPLRWSIVSNLIHKDTIESVDHPQVSIEALECHIDVIENGLECVFRSLIKTRAGLLNTHSH